MWKSGGGDVILNGGNYVFDAIEYNDDNVYNNGIYTCPVTGTYLLVFWCFTNNVSLDDTRRVYFNRNNNAVAVSSLGQLTAIIKANKGDTFSCSFWSHNVYSASNHHSWEVSLLRNI